MTCKDCIHCRACHEMWLIAVSQEDDFFERNDADTCEDFKHKYSFEEVVRCRDCEYWKNKDCRKDIALVSPNENDYCSYGKRRDTE